MTMTTLTSEFYTFSSILIMLIMRRWQDGSLSVSYHWSETTVSSYSFSHSSQALHSVVHFVFQRSFFFFPLGLYRRMPISCPRYLQILFSRIIPKFLWYSSFPSILAGSICFVILSLFRRSMRPYHLNLSVYVFNNVGPL